MEKEENKDDNFSHVLAKSIPWFIGTALVIGLPLLLWLLPGDKNYSQNSQNINEMKKSGNACFDQCSKYYNIDECVQVDSSGEKNTNGNCKFNDCFNGCINNN